MIEASQKEELKPVQWIDFEYDGNKYDLSHLHPRTLQFVRAAQGKEPAVEYQVDVIFSLHCLSIETLPGSDPKLLYSDSRETRTFDFERYELSKRLPAIIESLSRRKCFQTDRSDFVTVEVIREDATIANYHVFFTVSRATKRGHLNLYISSAYVASRKAGSSGRSIKFMVILHHTMNQIKIKA